jgi:hypothetical protein
MSDDEVQQIVQEWLLKADEDYRTAKREMAVIDEPSCTASKI